MLVVGRSVGNNVVIDIDCKSGLIVPTKIVRYMCFRDDIIKVIFGYFVFCEENLFCREEEGSMADWSRLEQ